MELRTLDIERQFSYTVVQKLDRAIKLVAVMPDLCPFLGKQKSTRNEQVDLSRTFEAMIIFSLKI
ncbi:hypothetical protein COR50_19520 [Chitinophaga caeni]|uniref:Uncharacterized protein n=1 Tax=Chitinophaga caeni TaxID=2029983 RepID=A0A291QZ15_9BACT|nr:hypothetical protein COR50_19520 [Chitinophaga caeni]